MNNKPVYKFLFLCALYVMGLLWIALGIKLDNINVPINSSYDFVICPNFVINSFIELLLVSLIYIGISNKVLARLLFNPLFFRRFNVYKLKFNSSVTVNNFDYDSISLLTYWADVIIIVFALRCLQLVEHSDLNATTVIASLIWFVLVFIYVRVIVNIIINHGYSLFPSDNSELKAAIDNQFIKLSGLLFLFDCLFWTGFIFLPGPPSGGIVISLFMFTAVSLIEEYTPEKDACGALWKDRIKNITLVFLGGLCFWLQWGENDGPLVISWVYKNVWKYEHTTTPPVHGVFYPLLTYSSIIIIAIWRAGERHRTQQELANKRANESEAIRKVAVLASDSFKNSFTKTTVAKNEKQHLLSLLQSAFHNLKKESDSLITYCKKELECNLSPTTHFRVENLAMSVVGMYVVVNSIEYEVVIRPVCNNESHDISTGMLDKLLLNIVNNVEYAKNLEDKLFYASDINITDVDDELKLLNAPDRNLTDIVDALSLLDEEKRADIIYWDTDTQKYWKVQRPKEERICNLIPEKSGIGLLRSLLSELIRNALKRTPIENPFFQIRICKNNDYLQFIFLNKCKDPNDWMNIQKLQDDTASFKKGGGSQSLFCSEQALKLKLQFEALDDYIAKVTLGVKIE